ncbi:MAG TPA: four helix bundle protein [Chitinophagaceae bacterium]|nr:four helix bundle protein [Chitinophagaceae bacterium]
MPARSEYKHLDLYITAKKLVSACYDITNGLPEHERALSGLKLRGAALSFYSTIIKGLTRRKRKKFLKKGRLKLFLLDGLLEIYKELHLVDVQKADVLDNLIVRSLYLVKKTVRHKR